MGRNKRVVTKTKEIQAAHLRNVRKALIDPGTNREMVQWKFAELIRISEPQLRLYEKCKSDIPLQIMENITKNPQILINGFPVRLEYLLGMDECMTLYDCVPHSSEEYQTIMDNAKKILNGMGNPSKYYDSIEHAVLHLFDINGLTPYTASQILNKKSFVNYMEAAIREDIDYYMTTLNGKDGE